jgi:hypothetical protein
MRHVVATFGSTPGPDGRGLPKMLRTWEYKFLVFELSTETGMDDSEGSFNLEGEAGWEVFAIVPNVGFADSYCVAVMKRPNVLVSPQEALT